MRIGMILEAPFPPDIRVEKEIRALESLGHDLALLCIKVAHQPAEGRLGKTRISRFQPAAQLNRIGERFAILYRWVTGRNRVWKVAIERFIKQNDIQVLHVHDLPLVLAGVAAARKARIPVVFDMHEIYPIMIRAVVAAPSHFRTAINTKLHSIMFSARWWDSVEQSAVKQADRIIVVVDESKQRLQRMGLREDKITVVLNVEDIDQFVALSEQAAVISEYEKDFLVGYVGGVESPTRGLDNLVKAWPLVLQRIPNARLLIVGDGPLRTAIEQLSRDLSVAEKVTCVGAVPFQEVPAYIKALQVAVIPHLIDEHTNHTIPHKLFQYLAMGKLVVTSDLAPIRRILRDLDAGVIVNEWSPQGFADAIVQASSLLRSGKHDPAGQVAALRKNYGFERMIEPLVSLYNELGSSTLDSSG